MVIQRYFKNIDIFHEYRHYEPPSSNLNVSHMAKILILDDESMLLELAQAQLEVDDHDLTTTMESSKAIDLMKQENFDLVVTDYNLEGQVLTGIDIAREAIKNNILVIIHSGTPKIPLPPELSTVPILKKPSTNLRKLVLEVLATKEQASAREA